MTNEENISQFESHFGEGSQTLVIPELTARYKPMGGGSGLYIFFGDFWYRFTIKRSPELVDIRIFETPTLADKVIMASELAITHTRNQLKLRGRDTPCRVSLDLWTRPNPLIIDQDNIFTSPLIDKVNKVITLPERSVQISEENDSGENLFIVNYQGHPVTFIENEESIMCQYNGESLITVYNCSQALRGFRFTDKPILTELNEHYGVECHYNFEEYKPYTFWRIS